MGGKLRGWAAARTTSPCSLTRASRRAFGATVPQQSLATQPSVLDNFLATHSGGSGAGGYSNKGFFDNSLNSLRSGGVTESAA